MFIKIQSHRSVLHFHCVSLLSCPPNSCRWLLYWLAAIIFRTVFHFLISHFIFITFFMPAFYYYHVLLCLTVKFVSFRPCQSGNILLRFCLISFVVSCVWGFALRLRVTTIFFLCWKFKQKWIKKTKSALDPSSKSKESLKQNCQKKFKGKWLFLSSTYRMLINLSLKDKNSNFSPRKWKSMINPSIHWLSTITINERAYMTHLETNLSAYYIFKDKNDYVY